MIYVICPAFYKTGGTELLHQLVYQLNKMDKEAVIAYSNCEDYKEKINPAFKKYVNTYVDMKDIKDQHQNVVVVPEIACAFLNNFNNIKKVIWWLSVDNFIRECGLVGRIRISGLKRGILGTAKRMMKGKYENIYKYIGLADLHLCQSFYALDYLRSIGVAQNKIDYLSDYLNDQYLDIVVEDEKERDNIILYNPQKGFKFTNKIIKCNSQYKWIPLINMNNSQILEEMLNAKLYIDFGYHPGKDRMPREAALAGCCIVTGRRGAAANDRDICIPQKYKIKENSENISLISDCIREIMDNYRECKKEFDLYRDVIRSEKERFIKDIERIFNI